MQSEQVNKILEYLTVGGKEVVSWYAHWYIISSLAWMGFGGLVIYLSFWITSKLEIGEERWIKYVIQFGGLFVGGLIIANQIPDLFCPYGIGAHQLIKDIRGN